MSRIAAGNRVLCGLTGRGHHVRDFAGNLFFQHVGQLPGQSEGGLAFQTGNRRLLQLTGDVESFLMRLKIKDFQGAERFWRFRPHQILYRPDALPLRWAVSPGGWSPNSLMTAVGLRSSVARKPAMRGNAAPVQIG